MMKYYYKVFLWIRILPIKSLKFTKNKMFSEGNVGIIEITFILQVLRYPSDMEAVVMVMTCILWDNWNWWDGRIYQIILSESLI